MIEPPGGPGSPLGGRRGGPLRAMGQRVSKAALPLGDSLEISTDILGQGSGLNPGARRSLCFPPSVIDGTVSSALFCDSDDFPEFDNSPTRCLDVSDLFVPPGSSHTTVD